uniref:TRAP transporter large permease n=1 Tax=Marinobacterium profundum TaxID=1714300 RepID=UPI00083030B5|nr:TRAP transporter large permease [Marinobacterium profundum]
MEAILVIGLLIGLILGGLWVHIAVGISALFYIVMLQGFGGLKSLGLVSWGAADSYTLSAIPLFVLMAEILLCSGLSSRLFTGLAPIVGRLPGGLFHTNVIGCGIFAAVSGGSASTAAAIGTVALPELGRLGYDKRLAAGSLAAGGTLGILIPPSITMIVYATFTETSIPKLFMAGVLPGILLIGLYLSYIFIRVKINPALAPSSETIEDKGLISSLFNVFPFVLLIGVVMGSIYGGIATPTEAGAIGAVGAMIIAGVFRSINLGVVQKSLHRTLVMSGNILFIVFVSMLFAYATALSGFGETLAVWLKEAGLSKIEFLLAALVFYAVLGCFMEGLGMIAITVPIIYPTLAAYGIDPIWFGIYMVILVELGQLTPPLGVILFVVASTWHKLKIEDVVMGTLPFFILIVLLIFILIRFPELALWLPNKMLS